MYMYTYLCAWTHFFVCSLPRRYPSQWSSSGKACTQNSAGAAAAATTCKGCRGGDSKGSKPTHNCHRQSEGRAGCQHKPCTTYRQAEETWWAEAQGCTGSTSLIEARHRRQRGRLPKRGIIMPRRIYTRLVCRQEKLLPAHLFDILNLTTTLRRLQ